VFFLRRNLADAVAVLALFVIDGWIASTLFHTDYIAQMGSIEAIFIALARYTVSHAGQLDWFPLWYGGIPFSNSYPPLLHSLVAAVSWAGRVSAGLAYHATIATVFALIPVGFYWSVRRLGAGRSVAFAGSLLYALLSPSCWLVPAIRIDAGGWLAPRRLVNLVFWGEGPHQLSLLFLPVAVAALHLALRERRLRHDFLAALALAAVVLSNWIGAFVLAVTVGCYLLAGWESVTAREWLRRCGRAAGIALFAYALALPWVLPSTLKIVALDAPMLVGWRPTAASRSLTAVWIAGVLLLAWLLRRWRIPSQVRFGAMLLWSMAVICLGAYWLHVSVIPQAERYHLALDLAFWLVVTLAAEPLAARLERRSFLRYAWLAVLVPCLPLAVAHHRRAGELARPIDIATTAEHRVSRWLDRNMPGQRVFAPGSFGFWMNAFGDTPMIVGGHANVIGNQILWGVIYQVYAGERLDVTVAWLKTLGCDAVVGDDPQSGEPYHPYAYPAKLHALPELWRDGAEVVYAIPRVRKSLAHALRPSDLPGEAPRPDDTKPLEPFLAALDDPGLPDATLTWRRPGFATVSADLLPDLLLHVQVAWDDGWHATVDGAPRRVRPDALGQVVIEPRCEGRCEIELFWDGGAERRIARIVSPAALLTGMVLVLLGWLRRKDTGTGVT
jgi:hypothetical protein